MAVSGKGDSKRPLLTSQEEYDLRDELWRCKDPVRHATILEILESMEQTRKTTVAGLQHDQGLGMTYEEKLDQALVLVGLKVLHDWRYGHDEEYKHKFHEMLEECGLSISILKEEGLLFIPANEEDIDAIIENKESPTDCT